MVNPIVFMIVKNGKPIYTYNYDNNVKKINFSHKINHI